ncbi:MAG: hypothetical protein L0213_00115, partial [Candidatus Dadabacteria bacterium]|nr:hypothetical protein [Candidatus Dadabacteria bacterium]
RDIVRAVRESQQLVHSRLKTLIGLQLLRKEGRGIKATYSQSKTFEGMKNIYSAESDHYCEFFVSILEVDGLMPGKIRKRGSVVVLEISMAASKERLRIECNPIVPVLRRLK